MIERFSGPIGKRALIDVLRRNKIVEGHIDCANAIAERGTLKSVPAGAPIIQEGQADDSIFLIVAGSFDVIVKGRNVGVRRPSEVVGEISAIDSAQRRSATIRASEDGVVVELLGAQFHELADEFPFIWKALAIDLSRRLVLRNAQVQKINEQANVFVICTVEALDVAQEIQLALAHVNALVTIWTNGVFIASHYPLESLEDALQHSDFAIAIAHPDDQTTVRGEARRTPRDNVIFELGFFMGRLGRKRTLLVEPRGENVKLPTDLSGITTIGYKPGPADKLAALLGPACTEIKRIINELGPRD
ncbi:TIR domain-containing protein (plasmid) [Azospirillum sp. A29]|uniref:TIR domain-containing protein n=1 Tax=Azospirillum sp. A29 TaxID=3160606 RepID=UPI00366DFE3F